MASTVRGRSLGISRSEMDASRLVFVYVQDSKPRRKVAVPIPDSYTWEQFIDKVREKLKISGVGDIYLSSSGHKVRAITQLQDIDELCVVEAPVNTVLGNGTTAPADAAGLVTGSSSYEIQASSLERAGSGTSTLRQQASERHKPSGSLGIMSPGGPTSHYAASPGPDDDEGKYVRRAHPLKRSLQRLFPGLFAPGLPVTNRDAAEGESGVPKLRRRRSRRSPYNLQNLLVVLAVMCCVLTMLFYLFRLQTPLGPPVRAPGLHPSNADPLVVAAGAGGATAPGATTNIKAVHAPAAGGGVGAVAGGGSGGAGLVTQGGPVTAGKAVA